MSTHPTRNTLLRFVVAPAAAALASALVLSGELGLPERSSNDAAVAPARSKSPPSLDVTDRRLSHAAGRPSAARVYPWERSTMTAQACPTTACGM